MNNFILIFLGVLLILIIIVLTSRTRIHKLYKKYLQIPNNINLTGGQFAQMACKNLGLTHLNLVKVNQDLVDAYAPKTKTLIMSQQVCDTASVASIAIVAHELGHALQDKQNNRLFGLVTILHRITRFTNKFITPLLLFGMLFYALKYYDIIGMGNLTTYANMIYAGTIFFILNVMVKISTIPLEYDASKKAIIYLTSNNLLGKNENRQIKKLLRVAARTYISSLFDGFVVFSKRVSAMFYNK